MVRLVVRRALELMALGVCVTFENPLVSYGFLLDELLAIAGMHEVVCVPTDHCQYGAPYQKGQIWLGNATGLVRAAAVCNHPGPHPDPLHGLKTRRSAPYPRQLVLALIEGMVAELLDTGMLGADCSEEA